MKMGGGMEAAMELTIDFLRPECNSLVPALLQKMQLHLCVDQLKVMQTTRSKAKSDNSNPT